MTEPETVTVPLPYGLSATYVMKPKPKPPAAKPKRKGATSFASFEEQLAAALEHAAPWELASDIRRHLLAQLTPEQRAAYGLSESEEDTSCPF